MSVSQVARRLERSAEWLRDAEKRGKIPRAKRDPTNGRRVYTEQDVERLRKILTPSA